MPRKTRKQRRNQEQKDDTSRQKEEGIQDLMQCSLMCPACFRGILDICGCPFRDALKGETRTRQMTMQEFDSFINCWIAHHWNKQQ